MIESFQGQAYEAHYLGFFDCFNRQVFYEAHEVLEDLWLADKKGPNGDFYKGLIQLAGAFVHLQKNRLRPAAALFKLTRANLLKYPAQHKGLVLPEILQMISVWLTALEKGEYTLNPLATQTAPQINPDVAVASPPNQ